MDIRTGKTYETLDDALADGVPESDIAEIIKDDIIPEVRFISGPFKNRAYKRTFNGLIRVDKVRSKE